VRPDGLLLALFLVGLIGQRFVSDLLRRGLWLTYFSTVAPVLVFATFLTASFDRPLLLAIAAAITATWLVGAVGYTYAVLVARTRAERGALALGASFGNSGFLGLPLAQLFFGHAGLSLAVVYGRLAWLVPDTSISTAFARLHGGQVRPSRPLLAMLLNPPLIALVVALTLRAAGVAPPVDGAESLAATAVGPAGFLLLGLSLPLDPPVHSPAEVKRAVGALTIRLAGGPAMLWLVGSALGADIPGVFYLLARMPCAFHLLVLARVYELRPSLMRLLVVGSTIPAVIVAGIGLGLARWL
jgi:predicted permease